MKEEEACVLKFLLVMLEILVRIPRFEVTMSSIFFLPMLPTWPLQDPTWKMENQCKRAAFFQDTPRSETFYPHTVTYSVYVQKQVSD